MYHKLILLQQGLLDPVNFKNNENDRISFFLELSKRQDLENNFTGNVNFLDLEENENRYLLSGCYDGSIYIHDLHNFTGNPQYTARNVLTVHAKSKYAHSKNVECVTWFPSDNRLFISSGGDKKIKLWDADLLKPLETFSTKGRVYHHQCSYESKSHIAVGSHVDVVELIDLRTGNKSHELRGHVGPVMTVAWSPREGHVLATAGVDSRAHLWDVRSSAGPLCKLDANGRGLAHEGIINALKFTPDGLSILTLGFDKQLRHWNASTGNLVPIKYPRVKNNVMRHVQISIAGNAVFVPTKNCIRVMNLWTAEDSRWLYGHFNRVNCCIYREAYQELYSGGSDRNVLVWRQESSLCDDEDDNKADDAWEEEDG